MMSARACRARLACPRVIARAGGFLRFFSYASEGGAVMDISLSSIPGIGPARLKALNNAGIFSVSDLVLQLPREYRDLRAAVPLNEMKIGDTAAVRVRVTGEPAMRRGGRLTIVKAFVTDGTDVLPAVWYNQPWLKTQLTPGRELLLYGKLEAHRGSVQLTSPVIEQEEGLIPVYRTIAGVPDKALRQAMANALKASEGQWPDELPEGIRRKYGLCERNFAMREAHFPSSESALNAARRRIAFEELLLYQLALSILRKSGRDGVRVTFSDADVEAYWKWLPFPPTGAQRRVLGEIAADMRSGRCMARLVQGDVGSGKTAVAFGAMAMCVKSGFQAAMMAPTEVLACQHYESAKKLMEDRGIRVGLLTGSLTARQHREAHEAIRAGEWDVVIGTHALITEGVEYKNLGLVVTDEQHRFGVRQRTRLSEKGESPNVLVMSATPIPRTLSLILYGDLDISIIDEMPPGRKPVATRIVPEKKRDDMYAFLRAEVRRGRQIYVVCPLVEESEAVDAQAAEAVYMDLKENRLPDLRVEMVHGRMKPKEKDAALERFRAGETDVLVSTTVIEVGVNVPNATVMVIENAERFGLAQLHQLRGRVGRGDQESWCFLMAEPNERLRLLVSTNDGFRVAEKDMEIRGPGEMLGTRQSGAAVTGVNLMAGDTQLLKLTHDEAREIMRRADEPEMAALIEAARARFEQKLSEVAMN